MDASIQPVVRPHTEPSSAPLSGVVEGEPRVSSSDIEGSFPQFARVELSELSKDARRGERLAGVVEFIQGRLGVVVVGLGGGGALTVTGLIGSFFTNAPLPLWVYGVSLGVGLIAGSMFRGKVERLFERTIKQLHRPRELLNEARQHGLVCGDCDYPLVDLPCCPECGPKK